MGKLDADFPVPETFLGLDHESLAKHINEQMALIKEAGQENNNKQ